MATGGFSTFEFDKVERFLKDIQKHQEFFETKSKGVWGFISTIAFADVIDHFEKERGPKGKWPKWSKSYRDAIAGKVAFRIINGRTVPLSPGGKVKMKPPREKGKKLQDTGRLRNTLMTVKNSARISKGIILFNPGKVKGGFPYAKAHNEGGPKLPQREYMWLSLKAMNTIAKFTARFMADGVEAFKKR